MTIPSNAPLIAITMGDATGVGPEVIMKSLAHADLYERCRPLVIGDAERLRQAGAIVGVALDVRSIETPEAGEFRSGIVDCLDLKLIPAGAAVRQAVAGGRRRGLSVSSRRDRTRRCGQGRRDLHGAAQQGGACMPAGTSFQATRKCWPH